MSCSMNISIVRSKKNWLFFKKKKLDLHHGQSTAHVLAQPSCKYTTSIRLLVNTVLTKVNKNIHDSALVKKKRLGKDRV